MKKTGDIRVISYDRDDRSSLPSDDQWIAQELNKGAGGKYLYLYYFTLM